MDHEKTYWNEEIETMPGENLQRLEAERLQKQMAYVYRTSPWYAERFNQAGVHPDTIKDHADLAQLPFTEKTDLTGSQNDGSLVGVHQCAPQADIIRITGTGGTTGRPLRLPFTRKDIISYSEQGARALWSMGCRPTDIVINVFNYSIYAGGVTGGDTLISGTLQPGWTVNGVVNGDLVVPPNTWQHWRVLLADRDARTKNVVVGANCEVMLLARDGVWRTTAPKALPTRTVNLTGASRADLAVRCSSNSNVQVANIVVANILVSGTADPGPHPYALDGTSMWSAARPAYLRDLRGVTAVHNEKITMGARTVNGSKFDINVPTFTLNANSVQEWSINGAGNHPFHLHVYHFQALAGCGGDFEAGEYYDTIAANCSVRFDLNAATSSVYSGLTIMHCHILAHEDQGAMTWMDVVGGTLPPAFPAGLGYDDYFSLSAAPPTTVQLGSVTVTLVSTGQGARRGQATVVVLDDLGNLVANATVTGYFTGSFNEPGTGITGASGTTVIQTAGTLKGSISVSFCVTNITHPSLNPWTGQVCDSN